MKDEVKANCLYFILPKSQGSARTRRKPRWVSRVSRDTQVRTVAVIGLSPSARLSKEPPRMTTHPRSPAGTCVLSLPLYIEASESVHSQRLPIMSATPCGVFPCGNEPTGRAAFVLRLARPCSHLSPHGNVREESPPRAAYSHSSSVGRRYATPSRCERQTAKARASSSETFVTGSCSWPGFGRSPSQTPGGGAWRVALTNSAYSALVTSVRSIAK